MTGTADVRLRNEERGPSHNFPDVYRSDDEDHDIEEPWDEPPALAKKVKASVKSPLLACVEEYFDPHKEEEEVFDDGDLPALSLNKKKDSSNTLLNGKTSTTKPLQAPSKAGLTEPPTPARTQEFWNQFEAPSDDTRTSMDDDAPDDELGELLKKEELTKESNEYYDEREAIVEDQFCDYSDMLDNMCGDPMTESSERQVMPQKAPKRNLKPINDIPMRDDLIEEQTAIEVEYVEPESPAETGWSPAKKNSYLAAMARKAKTEFNKTAKHVPEEKKNDKSFEIEEVADKDVYSSFNATEKRKFLRMVNSGVNPTESANKVMEEREAINANEGSKRSLAFWKKHSPKPERSMSPRGKSTKDDGSSNRIAIPSHPKREADPILEAGSRARPIQNNGLSDFDDDDFDGISSDENQQPSSSRNAAATAGLVAGTATVVTTAAIIGSKNSSETEPDIQKTFAKSGSSYYDAVRREPDVEVADKSALANKAGAKRSARDAPTRATTQSGFAALSARDERSMSNSAIKDDLESTKIPQKNGKGEVDRSGAISPDASTASKRRFRKLRGARPTGFAALKEDENEEGNNSTNRSAAIGAAAIGTTAVAGTTVAIVLSNSDGDEEEKEEVQAFSTMPEEEDDAERLEKDLLRPMGIAAGSLTVRTILEDEPNDADSNFDILSPQSLAVTPRGQAVEVDDDGMVNLDNYLDSATPYSSPHDQISVVSGKSHWTAATSASNHTTSSRVRRPGAAKNRLAKAKKADSATKNGWHESIKSAAELSNQLWDPKQGFADYQDPDTDMIDEATGEILHLDLRGVSKKKTIAQDSGDCGTSEVMPSVVYEDSEQMLNGSGHSLSQHSLDQHDLDEGHDRAVAAVPVMIPVSSEPSSRTVPSMRPASPEPPPGAVHTVRPISPEPPSRAMPVMKPRSPEQSVKTVPAMAPISPGQSSRTSSEDNRPKGWLESMKIASAKIAKDGSGPTWDPETGWQGLTEQTLSGTPTPKRDPPASPTRSLARSPAPDPDGVPPAVIVGGFIAVGADAAALASQPSDFSNERDMQPRSLEEVLDAAEPHAIDPPPDVVRRSRVKPIPAFAAPAGVASLTVEASDASVVSRGDTVNEKYVQIGDTGSVRSYSYNQNPSGAAQKRRSAENALGTIIPEGFDGPLLSEEEITENDTAPLLAAGSKFAKSTDQKGLEVVTVVKQKNTEDDINLFAHDSRTSFSNVASPESLQESLPSKRRGFGPVDIDEIDDMDFDDDDDNDDDSEMWASDQIMKSAAVAGTNKAIAATTKQNSARKANPNPPKLMAPKKDTSPIRERKKKATRTKKQARPQADPVGAEAVTTDSIRAADAFYDYQEEPSEDPAGNKNYRSNSVRASAFDQGNSFRASPRASPIGTRILADEDQSSSVKKLAERWESRGKSYDESDLLDQETPTEADQDNSSQMQEQREESPAGTAEWKSFLGKKVQAESAAAAKQEMVQRSRPDPFEENFGKNPAESMHRDEEVDEDDSVFDFKPSMSDQVGAFPTRVNSRPDDVADNFSEISPIQYDDGEDNVRENDNRMENVSDTGTNIEQGSFLKRLQACAAPIIPRQLSGMMTDNDNSVPSAHLAFMRTSQSPDGSDGANRASSSRYIPQNLCGRPDTISEDAEAPLPSPEAPIYIEQKRSSSSKKSRQRSSPKSVGSEVRSDTDEVFGARTSYLEAVAMKAAVSKPKRQSSRGRAGDERSSSRGRASDERSRSSGTSDVSSSSRRSERWQEFLDRKTAGVSPENTRQTGSIVSPDSSEVSKAAEKYAAQQVEQMMAEMSHQRSDDKQRQLDGMMAPGVLSPESSGDTLPRYEPYEMNPVRSAGPKSTRSVKKNESAIAAEELAAARVEAMMAAMTSQTLDEGEI